MLNKSYFIIEWKLFCDWIKADVEDETVTDYCLYNENYQ